MHSNRVDQLHAAMPECRGSYQAEPLGGACHGCRSIRPHPSAASRRERPWGPALPEEGRSSFAVT
uniref:Mlo8 n=1 Tax=Arundo donax TaxID=35708 RepID=A0A0A9E0V1_ARUDO